MSGPDERHDRPNRWFMELQHARYMFVIVAAICLFAFAFQAYADEQTNVTVFDTANDQQVIEFADGPVSFLGRSLMAEQFSGAVGVASNAAYILVVAGKVKIDDFVITPGDMLVIPTYNAALTKHKFDAERFSAGLDRNAVTVSAEFQTALDLVVTRQSRSIFLGRYQPTRLNIAALGTDDQETARRSVLGHSPIQKIRFSTENTPASIEAAVIEEVQRSLKSKDAEALASLLSPAVFGVTEMQQDGAAARTIVADRIINSENWSQLLSSNAFSPTDRAGVWRLETADTPINIGLRPLGDFIYVAYVDGGV